MLSSLFSVNNASPKIHVCWYVMPCRLVYSSGFWMTRIAFLFRVKRSKNISYPVPTKRNTCGRPRNLFISGVCLCLTKHVVASKCIRNHFVSEKYKTVQTFKLYFLKNRPVLQPCTTASDCKSVAHVPGSHFVKAFSGLSPHY